MPIISVFFGIIIRMFYKEHDPPHFHAEYQGQQAKFSFDGEMIVGNYPVENRPPPRQKVGLPPRPRA